MSSFINLCCKTICVTALSLCLISCANDYELLEENFYAKRYLETLQAANKGLENERYTLKITAFMARYGDRIVSNAYTQGLDMIENNAHDQALAFFTQLQGSVNTLISHNLDINTLPKYKIDIDTRLATMTQHYLETQLDLGTQAYQEEDYISSVTHFRNILNYDNSREDIQKLLDIAVKKGNTHIIVKGFYANTKSLPDTLKDEFNSILKTDSHAQNELKESALIRGVNVTDSLRHELLLAIKKTKNEFLSASTTASSTTSKNIVLRGVITAYEEDNAFTPKRILRTDQLRYQYDDEGIRRWNSAYFEYSIHEIQFSAHYTITVQLLKNDIVIDAFSLEETSTDIQRYKGDEIYWNTPANVISIEYPVEYERLLEISIPIDREFVIKQGIETLASRLAQKLTHLSDQ